MNITLSFLTDKKQNQSSFWNLNKKSNPKGREIELFFILGIATKNKTAEKIEK